MSLTETQMRDEVSKIIDTVGLQPAAAWFELDANSLTRFLAKQTIRNATLTVIKLKVEGSDRPKPPKAGKPKKAKKAPKAEKVHSLKKKKVKKAA